MHITLCGPASVDEVAPPTWRDSPKGMGGTPVNLLAKALLERGHQVHLVSCSTSVREPWTRSEGQLIVSISPYRHRARDRARDAFKVERNGVESSISSVQTDLVHAHWTYEFAIGALSTQLPTVVTAHDAPFNVLRNDTTVYRLLRLGMAYRAARKTKFMTAVAPYLQSHWAKYFRVKDMSVIPNIVPPMRVQSGVPHRILTVGDGSQRKNVWGLIRAFQTLREQVPSSSLHLVGPGLGPHDAIARRARTCGMDSGIQFEGALSRAAVVEQFAMATMYCHPSLEEAQPVSLLEAMGARVPVVAGVQAGGVSWTCGYGLAAELIDTRDPSDICRGMVRVIERLGYADYLASQGEILVQERYSAHAVAAAYESVYVRALSGI